MKKNNSYGPVYATIYLRMSCSNFHQTCLNHCVKVKQDNDTMPVKSQDLCHISASNLQTFMKLAAIRNAARQLKWKGVKRFLAFSGSVSVKTGEIGLYQFVNDFNSFIPLLTTWAFSLWERETDNKNALGFSPFVFFVSNWARFE